MKLAVLLALLFSACSHLAPLTEQPRVPASSETPVGEPIQVAISIDDIPMTEPASGRITSLAELKKIVDTFRAHHVPGVYAFVNSIWITPEGTDEPETTHLKQALKYWVDSGYFLANHTYSHPSFDDTSLVKFEKEIIRNEPYLARYMGAKDWHWFRYPFLNEGNTQAKRDGLRSFLKKRGYKIAEVSLSWGDSSWKDPYVRCLKSNQDAKAAEVTASYMNAARDELKNATEAAKKVFGRPIKHILLIHTGEFTAANLDALLTMYEQAGVQFIPFTEAEKDPVYETNPNFIGSGLTFTSQWDKVKAITDPVNPYILNDAQLSAICP